LKLRLGARGSALSLVQANLVRRELEGKAEIEIVTVRTTGDRLSAEGRAIGWKGDFTRELDAALLEGSIDLAVHSLKDVPSDVPGGLVLAAVPRREDPSDVLVSRARRRLAELPAGSRVGTSSPRRRAQLLAARPDFEVVEARGNVDTRLRRVSEGQFDAIVLARAGLARLGRLDEVVEVLPPEVMLPAVGQGALAVFAREKDAAVRETLGAIDHASSRASAAAERALLSELEAGCHAPVAGLASVSDGALRLEAAVFSSDGSEALRETVAGAVSDAASLGCEAARRLLSRGASRFLARTTL
jgi:hydroxymethylbilane synthase